MAQVTVNKCSECNPSLCCTYTTEPLGSMRSKADFNQLLWQVSHRGVEAYKDASGWYLLIRGDCEHLLPDGNCNIYHQRPQVCRDYTNDWCEKDESAETHFQLHFQNYADLLTYCRKRFKRWEDKQGFSAY